MVTKEMIGAAHDICLKKGDFVLSANLLERIYLAMRDKAEGNDSAGWDAYEDLRKASDETFLELRQRVAELEAVLREIRSVAPREVECHNMHHAKKDRHEFDETCPVVSRYAEAIAKIDEVLNEDR